MALNIKELSAGFGGGNTFQVFTYTSSVDDKTTINTPEYWEGLEKTLFKDGAVIYFTTKAGGDNNTVMGMKTWYPITTSGAQGGSIDSVPTPPEPVVIVPPEPGNSLFNGMPFGGSRFGKF